MKIIQNVKPGAVCPDCGGVIENALIVSFDSDELKIFARSAKKRKITVIQLLTDFFSEGAHTQGISIGIEEIGDDQ